MTASMQQSTEPQSCNIGCRVIQSQPTMPQKSSVTIPEMCATVACEQSAKLEDAEAADPGMENDFLCIQKSSEQKMQ
eukprot:1144601-Pelagomonas_calceolata.AAC.3